MIQPPELTKIDVMLMEFAALCYMRANGEAYPHEVDEYRQQILDAVAKLLPNKGKIK